MTYVLGINAYHGDASAALIKDGQVVLAIEEERLNRKKHCAGFPVLAIKACLAEAGISIENVDHIAISTDPSANLKEKVLYSLGRITRIHRMLLDRFMKVAKTADLKTEVANFLGVPVSSIQAETHKVEHHLAHLATAFYPSGYRHAALLSLDGMGDFLSAKWGVGNEGKISTLGQVEYPHSIGYLYTATTQFLGFPHYGDEGKVMGFAPYGKPVYLDTFRDMIRTLPDEMGYLLNLDYFRHHEQGIDMKWDEGSPSIGRMYSEQFEEVFGPARIPGSEYSEHFQNIAASLQARVEEVALHNISKLRELTGLDALGLAGGVCLNSVMNGKIRQQTGFDQVYIHPNAGDGGTSLGAALYVWHQILGHGDPQIIEHAYLGPAFESGTIEEVLKKSGLEYRKLEPEALIEETAKAVAEGDVVGWFQGRMEWGPRALGARSIVANPGRPDMKDILNERIKKREAFRPFAPAVLEEAAAEYFEQDYPSPAMLMVYQVREEAREKIPAVTHVDGSGRLQTVREEHHPMYYQLIKKVGEITGIPVILNTSFNENEPIVCTPEEAVDCFCRTRMDVLAIGDFFVRKDAK